MDLNGVILRNNIHKLNDEYVSMNNTNNTVNNNINNNYEILNQSPDIKRIMKSRLMKAAAATNSNVQNKNAEKSSKSDTPLQPLLDNHHSNHNSPKSRPLPTFFAENVQFSTKKERETPKLIDPPKPPIKSCPPISRLRPQFKPDYDGARAISFLNKKSQNDSDLISKHYDENKKDLFFEQCFIIEGTLGCGSFGKVYKVKSKEDGKYYAIKKSKEKFKGHADRDRRLEEVAKHEELPSHPNFVKFYRAWEEKQRLYIQIELCKMSLSTYAEQHHNIPEEVIWQFLIDLLQALKHLHDRKLVHMDIKPDNIFISYDGLCKLGDFGLVVDLKKNDLREVQEGDPKYLAPEVLNNNNNITNAADIFSLGMTILELATDLDLPRGGDPWHQLRNNQIPQHLIGSLSKELVEIIMKMIERDHIKRATVDELLNMPKIKNLIRIKKRKLFLSNLVNTIKFGYNRFYSFTLTLWYLMICPWVRLCNYINMIGSSQKSKMDYSLSHSNNDNCQTSTPKKSALMSDDASPLLTHHHTTDDDDNLHMYNENDCSFNNQSHLSPYVDTSSSFSDHSDFSLTQRFTRKSRTEPPLNKIHNLMMKTQFSPTSTGSNVSPTAIGSRTPPWKPSMASFASSANDSTPIRHRLVFDDENNKDLNNQNNNNNNNSSKIFEDISNKYESNNMKFKESPFKENNKSL